MAKKNVGILTFHCADDYGGMLQAYASKTYLNKQGYNADIINYSPLFMVGRYWFLPYTRNKQLKDVLKNVYYYNIKKFFVFRARRKAMRDFRENVIKPKGRKIYTINGLGKLKYDTYLFGSDQIWNPKITYKVRKGYFGEFKRPQNSKCVAYAASIGKEKLDEKYKEELEKYLKNFQAIALREESSVKYIQSLTKTPVEMVVDPTLLLSADEWDKIVTRPEEKKYVLVYFTEYNDELVEYAYKLSKKKNLNVIILNKNSKKMHENFKLKAGTDPSDFLGYIKDADYVITNSFHCTVMSVIFKKKFVVFLHKTLGARLWDLLNKVGLSHRIKEDKVFNIDEEINWSEVENKKNEFIKKSKDFIEKEV